MGREYKRKREKGGGETKRVLWRGEGGKKNAFAAGPLLTSRCVGSGYGVWGSCVEGFFFGVTLVCFCVRLLSGLVVVVVGRGGGGG